VRICGAHAVSCIPFVLLTNSIVFDEGLARRPRVPEAWQAHKLRATSRRFGRRCRAVRATVKLWQGWGTHFPNLCSTIINSILSGLLHRWAGDAGQHAGYI
jgi:hypothetical protein